MQKRFLFLILLSWTPVSVNSQEENTEYIVKKEKRDHYIQRDNDFSFKFDPLNLLSQELNFGVEKVLENVQVLYSISALRSMV